MAGSELRIGIVGCGYAARIHLDRLLALKDVRVVGCADADHVAAAALGERAGAPAFSDHRELLRNAAPEAVAIFTPHVAHYRPAMDALQAGCHLFIEKPLSTNLQEAADIVGLARARGLKVGVGHQYRLRPSLAEARRRLAAGAIGPTRLITASLALPWLAGHTGAENSWRFDPKAAGSGILADTGDHLIDALLWTSGQTAVEVSAVQLRQEPGLDVVTAAAIRLADGTPATLALSGVSAASLFELNYFGERGRLRMTDQTLVEERDGQAAETITPPEPSESIDGNFTAALTTGAPLCCPADEALDTVRLLEAITRSGRDRADGARRLTGTSTDLVGENRFADRFAGLTSNHCVNYQYGFALGNRRDRAQGEPHPGRSLSRGVLSPGPLGLRTDLMWDRLDMLATLNEPAPNAAVWDDGLVPPLIDRHPGDEEEDEEFEDEAEDDEEEDLEDDFDDEEDDFDDEEFDDDEELDEDLDDIDDIDVDEEDDLEEDDEDLDDLDDDEEEAEPEEP